MIVVVCKILLGFAALFYLASAIFMLLEAPLSAGFEGQKREVPKALAFFFRYAKWGAYAGIVLNAAVVIIHWAYNGYVPFVSVYQILAFLGVCFPLTYLYIRYVRKAEVSFAWFMLCSGICMIGCVAMEAKMIWQRPPALQSFFFLPHILCYMLSYSLCAVGFALTLAMVFSRDAEKRAEYEKAIYAVTITAFPFMLAGMFLGAIWANECWGNFWSWDPKETWALITTCLYAFYFHIRKNKTMKKLIVPVLILAFIALIITFLGINALGLGGQHSYS